MIIKRLIYSQGISTQCSAVQKSICLFNFKESRCSLYALFSAFQPERLAMEKLEDLGFQVGQRLIEK